MMALYVASHYKNSPNDLQLMADAPAHHLFVLLGMFASFWTGFPSFAAIGWTWFYFLCAGPVDESKNQLPDILCVIQVCICFPFMVN